MKKLLVAITAVIMAMGCVLFTACDFNIGDWFSSCGGVEGTYKLVSIKYGGKTYRAADGDEFNDITLSSDTYKITLNKDGTMVMVAIGNSESQNGTWANKEGDIYTLTLGSDPVDVTIKSGEMTITNGSGDNAMIITLKK